MTTIGEEEKKKKMKKKSMDLSFYPWSHFTNNNDNKSCRRSDDEDYQSPADIEEQMQLEFAIWRSGSCTATYEPGGSSEVREEAELHFDDQRALAAVRMPTAGLSFLVDPPGVCKKVVGGGGGSGGLEEEDGADMDSCLQEWIHISDRFYKVQLLSPLCHDDDNHHDPLAAAVELNPNPNGETHVDLLLSHLFGAREEEWESLPPIQPDDMAAVELHLCSTKLKRLVSQKRMWETLVRKLRVPLQECTKELKCAKEFAWVLEALAMFCSHYQAYLQDVVLSNEPAGSDQEEDNPYDDKVMLEVQIRQLDRRFQAQVCEQVNYAAAACHVAAEAVMEVSRLGARMLTGDEFSANTTNAGLDPSGTDTKNVSMLRVGAAQKVYDDISKLLDHACSSGWCSHSEDGPGLSDLKFCKRSDMERISPDLNTTGATSTCTVEASPEISKKKPSYPPPKKASKLEQCGTICGTSCPEESIVFQQQIAALCRSANHKAVLEGNVLQWCSVKFLKECYTIQIAIQVAEFMEDDLALWTTGISLASPLIVEIALEPLDLSQTLMAGAYQVCAYQGTWETRHTASAEPLIALACFVPHVVRRYLSNAQEESSSPEQPKDWLDQRETLIGLMKRIVHLLTFLKYKCVICEENHFDLGHGSSPLFPLPCAKNLCTVLFAIWLKATTPKKKLGLAHIKMWLLRNYKPSNRTDMSMLDNELKRFEVDSWHMNFREKIQMLALMISCKAKLSWIEVSAEDEEEPTTENNTDNAN